MSVFSIYMDSERIVRGRPELSIFFCILIANRRVGGWFAKTPIADNFEMIDFFCIFLHNKIVILSLMLPKYINTPASGYCMLIGIHKNETTNAK